MNTEKTTIPQGSDPIYPIHTYSFIQPDSWPLIPSEMSNRSNVGFPSSSFLIRHNIQPSSAKQGFFFFPSLVLSQSLSATETRTREAQTDCKGFIAVALLVTKALLTVSTDPGH